MVSDFCTALYSQILFVVFNLGCKLQSVRKDKQSLSFSSFPIRPVTPLGVNVDWPGWCFDDEDVLGFTGLDDETTNWFEQTPRMAELQKTPRHNDADYSEV